MPLYNTLTEETPTGAVAVFARVDAGDPWIQVEATNTSLAAEVFAKYLDEHDDARIEQIDDVESKGTDWGANVPVEDPNLPKPEASDWPLRRSASRI